jgi:hypothetical protein
MIYNYYYEAYEALVKDNDGVLPDLYELANLIISCHPSNLLPSMTVADVVALALVEMHTLTTVMPTPQFLPIAPVIGTKFVDLDDLLTRAAIATN